MPRLTMEAPHSLGREEALRRMKEKSGEVVRTFQAQVSNLHHEWNGDVISFSFKTAGMKFSGTGRVEDSRVTLDAELPLAAMLFKSKAEQRIRKDLDELLA